MMLNEDVIFHILQYVFSIEDACNFFISINVKPHGIFCTMLKKEFLNTAELQYNTISCYMKHIHNHGLYAILDSQNTMLDKRYKRRRCIEFESPFLRLSSAKIITADLKRYYVLTLQDQTMFFHLRLKGFLCNFVRKNNTYMLKNFKQHFTHNSLVVSIKGATNLSCNICATTFMKIKFNIMYDPFGRIFYPKILQYEIQTR